jgi:hypothetical protein
MVLTRRSSQGHNRARRRQRRSESFDSETIAGGDRAAVHAAEASAPVGDVRAEYFWHDEATCDRQIAPRAAAPGANLQNRALIQVEHHRQAAAACRRDRARIRRQQRRAGFGGHFDTTHGNRSRRLIEIRYSAIWARYNASESGPAD